MTIAIAVTEQAITTPTRTLTRSSWIAVLPVGQQACVTHRCRALGTLTEAALGTNATRRAAIGFATPPTLAAAAHSSALAILGTSRTPERKLAVAQARGRIATVAAIGKHKGVTYAALGRGTLTNSGAALALHTTLPVRSTDLAIAGTGAADETTRLSRLTGAGAAVAANNT